MDLQTKNNVVAALQNLLKDCSDFSAVVIESDVVNNDWTVSLLPADNGVTSGSFLHSEEVVDVCRTFKVYNFMCVEQRKGMAFVCVYIR